MNTKTLIILTLVFLLTLATAKPLVKQDSEVNAPSEVHKLIKRASMGEESSSKTMFGALTTTTQSESHKKKRICEEWSNKNFLRQWKCIKFLVVLKEN